jgi:hypothetical protein
MLNFYKANYASCKDQSPMVKPSSIEPLEALETNDVQAETANHQRTNPSILNKRYPMFQLFASQTNHFHSGDRHTRLRRNGSNRIEDVGWNKQQSKQEHT